jgi:hypothetical protein
MNTRLPSLVLALSLAACGSSSSGTNPPIDASSEQGSGGDGSSGNDGSSSQDGTTGDSNGSDSSVNDSSSDSGLGTGDANQTPCDPNDPSTCSLGLKCCPEPNHLEGGTTLVCATPEADGGACPQFS